MGLEEELKALSTGAQEMGEHAKDFGKEAARVRRKSKDLTEELHDLAEKVSNLAEAASVWRALGGFKRNRRNSKDLSEDVLLAAFQQIDKDKSGKIDRTELGDALKAENGNLKDDQIEALINFADTNGDGEIDFEEYKEIMSFQSGVVTSNAAAPSAATAAAPAASAGATGTPATAAPAAAPAAV